MASAQGQFWAMHDLLYEHLATLDDAYLRPFTEQLGLDIERFDGDMAEHGYEERVREDLLSGVRSGANGTPTFFINSVCYDSIRDEGPLMRALEQVARASG